MVELERHLGQASDLTGEGRNGLTVGMREGVGMAEAEAVSDAIAVERTLAGDRDAYRVLVERHSRMVYRMAFRMMGDAHEAEEVVQEAFVRGYQKLRQFAGQANFGTWVYRIAANYAIDRLRQQKVEERLLRAWYESPPDSTISHPAHEHGSDSSPSTKTRFPMSAMTRDHAR